MSERWVPASELRYVVRDGLPVLQQKWVCFGNPAGTLVRWQDVPTGETDDNGGTSRSTLDRG